MPLKDRPRDTRKPIVHGAPCSVGQVYRANLNDPEELAELHSLLYREDRSGGEVWAELTESGYDVSQKTVNKHRGKNCRCFRIDKDFCPDCKRHLAAHDVCDAA